LISDGISQVQESDAAGFLGVRMEIDPTTTTSLMELKQTGLIDRIDRLVETLGLDISKTSGKFTPANAKPLQKNTDGDPTLGDNCYMSVARMLPTWLDIQDLTLPV